ncbi:hypothetical protein I6I99_17385 [Sphingobacterium multivorum]|nr:hypothetical protein [Sphingobacterium multivorum]QQT29116.1 hypothetical protein I6I99_17385 [Sphingobacterium multivorum]
MKNRFGNLIVLCGFLLALPSCKSQKCNLQEGRRVFEEELQSIKLYIGNQDMKVDKISVSITRIEKLTSIASESDGNYLGKFNPTVNDIRRWTTWYNENKDNICWDKDKQDFYLKKTTH